MVLRLLAPGDAFGGVAAFGGSTYPVSAEAVTLVSADEWPGAVMASLMERYPKLAMNALRLRIRAAPRVAGTVSSARDREGRAPGSPALLRLVQQAGRPVESGVLIDLRLSREDIAQMTGTTLFTVSRLLSRLEADGVIEAGRQRVVVSTRTP